MRKQKQITLLGEEIKIFARNAVDALASDNLLMSGRLKGHQFLTLHAEIIWDSIQFNWTDIPELKWFELKKKRKHKEQIDQKKRFESRQLIKKLSVLELFQVCKEIYLLEGVERDYLELALGNKTQEELSKEAPKKKDLSQKEKQSKL